MGSTSETSTNYQGFVCPQINLNNAYDVDLEEPYSAYNEEVAPHLGINSCPQHDSDMEKIIPLTQTEETEMKNKDTIKECREELWPKNIVQTLVLKFEDVYVNLNHGNLGKKH